MIAPVERTYWRRLGGTAALKDPPEYGADLPGLSVFGRTPLSASLAGSWDMNRLPCVLSTGLGPEADLPGVTTPMLYIGVWRALFGWHTEDMVRPMIAPPTPRTHAVARRPPPFQWQPAEPSRDGRRSSTRSTFCTAERPSFGTASRRCVPRLWYCAPVPSLRHSGRPSGADGGRAVGLRLAFRSLRCRCIPRVGWQLPLLPPPQERPHLAVPAGGESLAPTLCRRPDLATASTNTHEQPC